MLQWNDGNWEHRAYWGSNNIDWGVNGTDSRRYMGPSPSLREWVRLEVSASLVGLEGRNLNGMAFTLFDGRATGDRAGKSSANGGNVLPAVSSLTTSTNNAATPHRRASRLKQPRPTVMAVSAKLSFITAQHSSIPTSVHRTAISGAMYPSVVTV